MTICSNNDWRFLEIAADEASKSKVKYHKHGCVAVASGKVVARGCNHYRAFSKDGLLDNACTCHAEIDVLRKCLKRHMPKKLTIYVVRVSQQGNILLSQPCVDCHSKMKDFPVKNIIYSGEHNEICKMKMKEFSTSFVTSGHRAIQDGRM
jgi:deoxycytidylate deaminase